MYLRVFTPDGLVLSEVPDVAGAPSVTGSGALVVPLADGTRYVVNPLAWSDLTEHPDPPGRLPDWLSNSVTRRASRAAFLRGFQRPPVVPGPAEPEPEPEPQRRMPSDGEWPAVVHEAPATGPLSVVCICDVLRCPTILNPSDDAERGWWRKRQKPSSVNGSGPPSPQPLMRCSFQVGHGGEHKWLPGDGDQPPGWPFGPNRHHEDCPRHPSNQRPEGQPGGKHAAPVTAGITGVSELVELAHEATDPAVPEVGTAEISLVRPKPTDDPETWMRDLRAVAGNSGPGMALPDTSYNPDRPMGICGRWAPAWDRDPRVPDRWCQLIHPHPGPHEHRTDSNGETLRWRDDDIRGQAS